MGRYKGSPETSAQSMLQRKSLYSRKEVSEREYNRGRKREEFGFFFPPPIEKLRNCK